MPVVNKRWWQSGWFAFMIVLVVMVPLAYLCGHGAEHVK